MARPNQTVYGVATTHNPTTRVEQDADSLPTAKLIINDVVDAALPTVVNIGTGLYSVSVALPASASIGKTFFLVMRATVAGVTGRGVAGFGEVDALHLIRMAMAPKKITLNKDLGTTKVFDTDGTTKLFETKVQAGASDDEVDLVDVP